MKKWSFFHFILIKKNIFFNPNILKRRKNRFQTARGETIGGETVVRQNCLRWNCSRWNCLRRNCSRRNWLAAKLSCGETVCGETVWGESGSRWKCLRWNCSQRNRLRRNFLEPASKYGDEAHSHVQNQWRSFYYFVPNKKKIFFLLQILWNIEKIDLVEGI